MGVGVGAEALNALITTVLRVYEELGVNCFVLIYTSRTRPAVDSFTKMISGTNFARFCRLPASREEPGLFERWLRKDVVECFQRVYGSQNLVVIPTPTSRRVAAALALASRGDVEVVHIDFYWGLWTGLPYPLVPRVLEPLYILHPVAYRYRGPTHIDSRVLRRVGKEFLGVLPPIRRGVAELALNMNMGTVGTHVVLDGDKLLCDPVRIVITLKIGGEVKNVVIDNWCSVEKWFSAVDRVRHMLADLCSKANLDTLCQHLVRASGLDRVVLDDRPAHSYRESVVVDTNLVYWGIHNDCWEGTKIVIPYAVQAEILRRYAEALKKGVYDVEKRAIDILTYYQLEELLHCSGQSIIPSPPPPADTAIPSIDTLLLTNRVIATGDLGAYRLWQRHPVAKIATPKLAKTEHLLQCVEERGRAFADAVYSLLQLATLTRIIVSELRKDIIEISIHAKPYQEQS